MTKKIIKEEAVFGAGCFWGVEEDFRTKEGVVDTEVGYAGGASEDTNYEKVCTGDTGHAEVVRVFFNKDKVSYEQLVDFFFKIHDPTTLNMQGPDRGSQYRSAIFYTTDEQRVTAEKAVEELSFEKDIVTEVTPKTTYIVGEEYHQKYLLKKGVKVCH
jgi:peptide-methionine (S)-S-oxide reductase